MLRQPNPWVVISKPRPEASLRLFCFPFAGGGASVFRLWADHFPPSVEVCAVQPPGRENRLSEPRFTSAASLASALAPALAPLLDKPYALFGHSMGSVAAFQFAHHQQASGSKAPVHLFLSGRRAPHVPKTGKLVHTMTRSELLAYLRNMGGTPEAVLNSEELMDLMLPCVRDDFQIADELALTGATPLPLPIAAFCGTSDGEASPDAVAEWNAHTTAAFDIQSFAGGHFFLNTHRAELCRSIAQRLQPYCP